jgi:glycosyltransferase involved in cell wall biosynthesis
LLNAIESVKNQTYSNIEIIVVNDCSTQKEYYEYDFKEKYGDNFTIIHLEQNSKSKFGFACAAYVRNFAIEKSTGKYIAFLDDDDSWFPNKLDLQLKAMNNTGCKMSCTDGLIGNGIYDKNKTYQKYNAECNYNVLQNIYKNKGSKLLENGFPEIWDYEFINIHNCCICSSVIIEKHLLENINYMKNVINGQEDYDCWLRILKHTNCIYINDICFYYDVGHGDGQNY